MPPRIAAPEHAVLDFSTVGRSAHRVIRAQLAALLRDTQRHLDRRDAVSADTALKHVSSTWRVRTPRSSVWSFYLTRRPACSHAPCCHQVNRMTKRMCGHTRFVIMIHPQHHCRVHTRYLMRYTPTGGDRLLSSRSPLTFFSAARGERGGACKPWPGSEYREVEEDTSQGVFR